MKSARRAFRFMAFAAVAAGAPSLGCVSARAQALEPVTIASTRTMTDLPFFIAQSRGYFRDEGLEVKTVDFDSGARMMPALATGEIDAATGGPSAGLYNAIGRGIALRIVSDKSATPPGRHSQTLLARKAIADAGRLNPLSGIKGLKIASAASGSSAMGTLNRLLAMAGLKHDDVERVYLGVPQQIAALQNGAIDIGMPTEPVGSEILRRGYAVKFMTDDQVYPGHQVAVMFYSDKFRLQRRPVALAFMRAYLRAVRVENASIVDGRLAGPDGAEFIDLIAANTAVNDRALLASVTMSAVSGDGQPNVASLREDFEVFRAEGLLEGDPRFEDALDLSIATEAARQLDARGK